MDILNNILEIIKQFGAGQGIFIILILAILYFLYTRYLELHRKALDSKDEEIKRLAEENKEYRQLFKELMKERLDIGKKEQRTSEEDPSLELKKIPIKEKQKKE